MERRWLLSSGGGGGGHILPLPLYDHYCPALPFTLTGSFAGVKAASLQLLGSGHVCLQRTSPAAAAVVLLSFACLTSALLLTTTG